MWSKYLRFLPLILLISLTGCLAASAAPEPFLDLPSADQSTLIEEETTPVAASYTEQPRPNYAPGELVSYTAQTGDTLPTLAARFNTTAEEILAANPFIPPDATTMPPGMPMEIPIYYKPFWGTQYQVLPDSHFINGPAQQDFDTAAFLANTNGWLRSYTTYVSNAQRTGAGMIDYIAVNYSISPRLLLALLEYQLGALSDPVRPAQLDRYALGFQQPGRGNLYSQLTLSINLLNDGYYRFRNGTLIEFDLLNGRVERLDPWQNAATAALQRYYATIFLPDLYREAISPNGFAATYQEWFGDPWVNDVPHIPGSLTQPDFQLPFVPGRIWAYTGGPHTGWGRGEPFAAIDFAPPSETGGCVFSGEWATAVADGVIVRTDVGVAVLDLDGDGDERTGWTVLYLHLAADGKPPLGAVLKAGDLIGHPSCEGGSSTGTHIHIARKYNGEWMVADGMVPFNLDGWVVKNGAQAYQGTMEKFSQTIIACECSNQASHIKRDKQPVIDP